MGTPQRQRAGTATWQGFAAEEEKSGGKRRRRAHLAVGSGPLDVQGDSHPLRLGPYRLLGLLGQGGMARVYLGEHTAIGKRVAIKTLLPEYALCAQAHEALLREARIASTIRHPHLIDIYDFGRDELGRPYCVMELALGESLAQTLERGPLPLSQSLGIAIHVADAVAAIHAAGFLHRDIKSENVLLTSDGRRRVAKLIDFGIAKRMGANLEFPIEGIVGTPLTMAPEQISQDDVDERTDVWALGVLLYEMLSGRLPFPSGGTIRDELVGILTLPPRPLPPELTDDVRDLVFSCLSKDPEERPPSATALVGELRGVRSAYLARHESIDRSLAADEERLAADESEAPA